MKNIFTSKYIFIMLLVTLLLVSYGCEKSDTIEKSNDEQEPYEIVGEYETINARDAYTMAQIKAKKWNPEAKLFQMLGRDTKINGTAGIWQMFFATKLDEREGNISTKYMVTVKGGRISEFQKIELGVYTGFLPDNWIDSTEAYPICINALIIKYQEVLNTYRMNSFVLQCYDPYYTPLQEVTISKGDSCWMLQFNIESKLKQIFIDAIDGNVIAIE